MSNDGKPSGSFRKEMNMLVVPYACAEFHNKFGEVLYRITADQLRIATEIPESVKEDPLFALMVKDGSLKAPDSKLELKVLENDPDAKITKTEKPAKAEKSARVEKSAKGAGVISGTTKAEDGKAGEPGDDGASGNAKAENAKTRKALTAEGSAMEPAKPENQTAPGEAKASAAAGKQ